MSTCMPIDMETGGTEGCLEGQVLKVHQMLPTSIRRLMLTKVANQENFGGTDRAQRKSTIIQRRTANLCRMKVHTKGNTKVLAIIAPFILKKSILILKRNTIILKRNTDILERKAAIAPTNPERILMRIGAMRTGVSRPPKSRVRAMEAMRAAPAVKSGVGTGTLG